MSVAGRLKDLLGSLESVSDVSAAEVIIVETTHILERCSEELVVSFISRGISNLGLGSRALLVRVLQEIPTWARVVKTSNGAIGILPAILWLGEDSSSAEIHSACETVLETLFGRFDREVLSDFCLRYAGVMRGEGPSSGEAYLPLVTVSLMSHAVEVKLGPEPLRACINQYQDSLDSRRGRENIRPAASRYLPRAIRIMSAIEDTYSEQDRCMMLRSTDPSCGHKVLDWITGLLSDEGPSATAAHGVLSIRGLLEHWETTELPIQANEAPRVDRRSNKRLNQPRTVRLWQLLKGVAEKGGEWSAQCALCEVLPAMLRLPDGDILFDVYVKSVVLNLLRSQNDDIRYSLVRQLPSIIEAAPISLKRSFLEELSHILVYIWKTATDDCLLHGIVDFLELLIDGDLGNVLAYQEMTQSLNTANRIMDTNCQTASPFIQNETISINGPMVKSREGVSTETLATHNNKNVQLMGTFTSTDTTGITIMDDQGLGEQISNFYTGLLDSPLTLGSPRLLGLSKKGLLILDRYSPRGRQGIMSLLKYISPTVPLRVSYALAGAIATILPVVALSKGDPLLLNFLWGTAEQLIDADAWIVRRHMLRSLIIEMASENNSISWPHLSNRLITVITTLAHAPSYTRRLLAIDAITLIDQTPSISRKFDQTTFRPLISRLMTDTVPNVRCGAALSLAAAAAHTGTLTNDLPIALLSDPDPHVANVTKQIHDALDPTDSQTLHMIVNRYGPIAPTPLFNTF